MTLRTAEIFARFLSGNPSLGLAAEHTRQRPGARLEFLVPSGLLRLGRLVHFRQLVEAKTPQRDRLLVFHGAFSHRGRQLALPRRCSRI